MTTLEKYEASRNIAPTIFEPKELKDYKIIRYLAKKGTAVNKSVSSDLFTVITKISAHQNTIQAIGIHNNKPVVLILQKS